MTTLIRTATVTVGFTLALGLAACQGEKAADGAGDSAAAAAPAAAQGAQGMPGMEGMEGMQGGMMGQMQAHMKMMETTNGDSLKAMLPMHRQMTANMISEMNREMKGMNMTGDAAWTATMDSLRRDLTNLPEMSAAQLRDFMPEHRGRMMRLMEMHQGMMKNMKM